MYNAEWHREYYKINRLKINAYIKKWRKKRWAIDPSYQKENRKKHNKEYCKGRYARDAKMRKRLKEYYQEQRKILNDLKDKPCFDCKQKLPPYVMEFDHRNPKEKLFSPSRFGFVSKEKFEIELKKCDVVCANCHRIRTHKQRLAGFFRQEGFNTSEKIKVAEDIVV